VAPRSATSHSSLNSNERKSNTIAMIGWLTRIDSSSRCQLNDGSGESPRNVLQEVFDLIATCVSGLNGLKESWETFVTGSQLPSEISAIGVHLGRPPSVGSNARARRGWKSAPRGHTRPKRRRASRTVESRWDRTKPVRLLTIRPNLRGWAVSRIRFPHAVLSQS
jgi:hypothetical protein